MNKYQLVMPNGDFMAVAADRMENVDGDLKFFQGNTVVGEARYWQAWSLVGTINDSPKVPQSNPPVCNS